MKKSQDDTKAKAKSYVIEELEKNRFLRNKSIE